jgi:SAM-dependent methyltransferase
MTDMTPAEAYERFLVPNVFEPWARQVIDGERLRPAEGILDVACGTGIAARLAAASVGPSGRVVGVDIDEKMLAVAGLWTPPDGAASVEWRQADALDLPLAESSFDVVLCFEGLQFLPDRAKGLREFRRVCKPGGRIAGTVWGPVEENPGYHALAEGLARFVSPDAARLPPFMLSDAGEIAALLAGAGFAAIRVEPRRLSRPVPSVADFVDWVAAGAPTTRHKLSLLAAEDRQAFLRFVEERLAPYTGDGVLEMPYMRHVFTARVRVADAG